MAEKQVFKKDIPIKRIFPDNLQSYFVSNLVVQHQEETFTIAFFEVWPPPILGTEEEKQKQLENFKFVEAKCVARLVITPNKMKEFIDVLSGSYTTYKQTFIK